MTSIEPAAKGGHDGGSSGISIGWKLGSHRVSVFEALVGSDLTGLTIPEICRAGRIPRSTSHRILSDFLARGVVTRTGKRGKAPVFRVNTADPQIVEVARALTFYLMNVARLAARARDGEASCEEQVPSRGAVHRVTFDMDDPSQPRSSGVDATLVV